MFNKIKALFKSTKTDMAPIQLKPINPQIKEEVLEALTNYKKQNPKKYEAKKAELFARYGLTDDTSVEETKDTSDIELETIKAKTKKTK